MAEELAQAETVEAGTSPPAFPGYVTFGLPDADGRREVTVMRAGLSPPHRNEDVDHTLTFERCDAIVLLANVEGSVVEHADLRGLEGGKTEDVVPAGRYHAVLVLGCPVSYRVANAGPPVFPDPGQHVGKAMMDYARREGII